MCKKALLLLFVYLLCCISVCFLQDKFENSGLKSISNVSMGELFRVMLKFLFIPGTLRMQVSEPSEFVLSILTQNLYLHV